MGKKQAVVAVHPESHQSGAILPTEVDAESFRRAASKLSDEEFADLVAYRAAEKAAAALHGRLKRVPSMRPPQGVVGDE